MGDRSNIVLKQEKDHKPEQSLYLYTHWRGSWLFGTLAEALKRGKGRWDDPSYLARIIFCEMMGVDDEKGTTGFGISVGSDPDNEHAYHFVDVPSKTVEIREADWSERNIDGKVLAQYTFGDLVGMGLTEEGWEGLQRKIEQGEAERKLRNLLEE